MSDTKDGAPAISFNIKGEIAETFEKVRAAAKSHPDFWSYGNLTRTDLARRLLMDGLVDLAKQLGVLEND